MLQPKDKDWPNGYKNKPTIYAIYKRLTSNLGTHTDWKWGGWKKIFCVNEDQKKAGIAILISDKIYIKYTLIKTEIRDKGKYIMIKESIQGEDIANIIYMHSTQ